MTGSAVNLLSRAAYAKSEKKNVKFLVPYAIGSRSELVSRLTSNSFYPENFPKERRSIIPVGDTSQFIQSRDADIAILEEPEHLNWYHHGKRWSDNFNHVVGIVRTNYLEYVKREKNGSLQASLVKHINNWATRAYCDKDSPKFLICNVHGVNPKFLKIGEKAAANRQSSQQISFKGAYFLGKIIWAKGYRYLIHLLAKHKTDRDGFNLDV
ncbi:hypothetical protein RND71_004084 [Anisodus tanguticus]|uniref:Uncharacterized protein n=1 Tax=Anisodus tanguticus TaxID=243964 RepID=A0AAE1SUF4_9SOLA|nr:hypothetical protein RND71_004084 [Anisodus tanguticus]